MCEAVPWQVNYLIDEASEVGKGANMTVCYVHHYFQNHGLGESHVHRHADNCMGQNKNNCFLWYLAWRAINHLHESIRYSFLIAGHVEFGPTRCFGIIKRSYKVSHVLLRYEFAQMVKSSSAAGVNKAQHVRTHDGKVIVPVYNWSTFLEHYFIKFPNIKKYNHFRFSTEEPSKLYFKESSTSPDQTFTLRRTLPFCRLQRYHPSSNPKDYLKNGSSISSVKFVTFVNQEPKIWLPQRHERLRLFKDKQNHEYY